MHEFVRSRLLPRQNHLWVLGALAGILFVATIIAASIYVRVLNWSDAPDFAPVLAWQLLSWLPWLAVVPGVFAFSERFPMTVSTWRKWLPLHLALSAALTAVLTLWFMGVSVVSSPFGGMEETKHGVFRFFHVFWLPIVFVVVWALIGVAHAKQFEARVRDQERKEAALRMALVETQLRALKLQMRPHFLFNTLNTLVVMLRRDDTVNALRVTLALSEMLRMILAADDRNEVPLSMEVGLLDKYLELEGYRYGDRLRVNSTVDPNSLGLAVPSLLLQPLVENAICYGMASSSNPGAIDIAIERQRETLSLKIVNDTPAAGTSRETHGGHGIALGNIRKRLSELYGDAHRFVMEELDGRTRVAVLIPAREALLSAGARG